MKNAWYLALSASFLVGATFIGCRRPAPYRPAPAPYAQPPYAQAPQSPAPTFAPQSGSPYGESPAIEIPQESSGSGTRITPPPTSDPGRFSAPSSQGSGSR